MSQERPSRDWLTAGAVWLVTGVLFTPAALWLARRTFASEQLINAFAVLVFAAIILMRERRYPLVLRFQKTSTRDLLIAFAAMAAAMLLDVPLLTLFAFCFALSAAAMFVFGDRVARAVYSLLAAFALFVALSLVMPAFDWPLRQLAGSLAAWMLGAVGQVTQLGLTPTDPPKLLMLVNGRPFEVAPECNGFGLITGSAMLAVLLTLYRRIALFDKALVVGTSILLGLVFNSLRILVICLLAPLVGKNYAIMHETIGLLTYAVGLGAVWWLARGMPIVGGEKTT